MVVRGATKQDNGIAIQLVLATVAITMLAVVKHAPRSKGDVPEL